MAHLHIGLFGSFHVTLDARPATAFGYDKVRALLIYLALEAEHAHTRDFLAGLLWPESDERQAHRNLSQALLTLRHALGTAEDGAAQDSPLLLVAPGTLQFNLAADCTVDALVLRAALATCRTHPHPRLDACAACLNALDAAVATFQGGILPGFALDGCPEFEQWLVAQQQHYQRLAVETLAALAAAYETRGEYGQCLTHARTWLALEPYQEEAHCQVMRGLALSGDRTAALGHYDACVDLLRLELDVEPSPATQALYAALRSGAGPAQQVSAPLGNLPAALTPLIGRRAELDAVCRLLGDESCRLVSLVGPGGAGKTRLALAVAGQLSAAFPDGAYWVDLQAEGGRITHKVAQVVGLNLVRGEEPTRPLFEFLRTRHLLIVLDGCDQQAPDPEGVVGLLQAGPGLKLLVTSRTWLNMQAEHVFPLAGLAPAPHSAPHLAGAGADPGVELFLHAAGSIRSGYTVTPADLESLRVVCRGVDGLPLAILLAASWIDVLTPQQLAARLAVATTATGGLDMLKTDWQDLPARHQSMRTVLDHSWALLSPADRQLVAQLSLLQGEFSGEAAEAVATATLRDLRRLVTRSMLEPTADGHYTLHLLIRQYAAEQRSAEPELDAAVHSRHSAYYCGMAAQVAGALRAGQTADGYNVIEANLGNIKVAWDHAAQHGSAALLAAAADAYCGFYSQRGRLVEGLDACVLAARHLEPTLPIGCLALAFVTTWQATFERLLGEQHLALVHLRQSLAWLDNPELRALFEVRSLRAFALYELGWLLAQTDSLSAQRTWEEARVLCRDLGDIWAVQQLNAAMETLAPLLATRGLTRYDLRDFDL